MIERGRPATTRNSCMSLRSFVTPRPATLILAMLITAACAQTGSKGPAPLGVADYTSVLADPARPADDKKDDAARKPAEVLAFAQIRPGDTVLEMEAGRGWYSDLLSSAIGPTGK